MSDTDYKEIDKEQVYFTYKRCPYCYTHLKLTADHCMECRQKVGPVDKLGLAKKPFNYKAYIAAAMWLLLLGIYCWKFFYVKIMAAING